MTDYTSEIRNAGLQDVHGSSLQAHVPNPLALESRHFLVEYGIRADDQAMVFHFFSPRNADTWDADYKMDERLKRAIDANFDTRKVSAGFVSEMDSFYVIVGGLGSSPDPWPLVARFLRDVELPLAAPS